METLTQFHTMKCECNTHKHAVPFNWYTFDNLNGFKYRFEVLLKIRGISNNKYMIVVLVPFTLQRRLTGSSFVLQPC